MKLIDCLGTLIWLGTEESEDLSPIWDLDEWVEYRVLDTSVDKNLDVHVFIHSLTIL